MKAFSWYWWLSEFFTMWKTIFFSIINFDFLKIGLPLLGIWELIPRLDLVPRGLLPPPSAVFLSMLDLWNNHQLAEHLATSFLRFGLGFLAAVVLAIPIGVFLGWSPFVRRHFLPLFQLLAPVPPPAWVPLTIILLGLGMPMQVFLVFLGVFYPVMFNTYNGTKETNRRFISTARLFGASELTTLLHVIIPSAFSSMVMGMKIGTAMGLVCVVISEMFGARSGIGWLLLESKEFFRIDRMLVCMVILGFFGWLVIEIFKYIENRLSIWKLGVTAG